jgi:hypothetical protein
MTGCAKCRIGATSSGTQAAGSVSPCADQSKMNHALHAKTLKISCYYCHPICTRTCTDGLQYTQRYRRVPATGGGILIS